jgi:carbon-monoxide dehydrogenase medium subunit
MKLPQRDAVQPESGRGGLPRSHGIGAALLPGNAARPSNSHILVNRFDYCEPATLAEAIDLLVEADGAGKVVAGGTDLLVQMKMERVAPAIVVSVNAIPGLDTITAGERGLCIGATATVRAVETDPHVRARYPALAEACASFSSVQVQSMGTIGGNLGNASPASDSAPALIAFDAEIELAGPAGETCLPLDRFFRGPGVPALEVGQIITGVVLPAPRPGTGSAFLKIGRVANDVAKANCAVLLAREGQRITSCRVAFGSVAPTPLRVRAVEEILDGQIWSEHLAESAARAAAEAVAPIDDVRSTARYRREIVRVMAGDGLRLAWRRTQRGDADGADALRPNADRGSARIFRGHQISGPGQRIGAGERKIVELNVNGEARRAWVAPNDLLLNVLRDDLELTGTKYGCGIGECSACTVLMDGAPVLACLVLAAAAGGHKITTIEGLAGPDGKLDPLQEAFIDQAAFQCGYCTPGMILTAKALLAECPRPSEDDIRHHLRGNLCRCTGYASIVRAVLAASERPAG